MLCQFFKNRAQWRKLAFIHLAFHFQFKAQLTVIARLDPNDMVGVPEVKLGKDGGFLQ